MHRCKDCRTTYLHPNKHLCPSCKVIHDAKTIANSRKNYLAKYHTIGYQPREAKPRKCRTCENMITGRNLYCNECKAKRAVEALAKHVKHNKLVHKPKYKTTTDMVWLDDINAFLASQGGVYHVKANDMQKCEHVSKILRVRI